MDRSSWLLSPFDSVSMTACSSSSGRGKGRRLIGTRPQSVKFRRGKCTMESNHIETSLLSKEEAEGSGVRPGVLDGMTIMRYAPFYRERSNGGVEQSLRALNHGLLQRHRLTVLQVHRVSDVRNSRIEVEKIGKGRILWIPVAYRQTASRFGDLPIRAWFVYDQTLRLCQQNGDGMQCSILNAVKAVLRNRLEDLRHRSVILSDPLSRLLLAHKVNLLALHGLTYDAEPLVVHAKAAGVPFVLISHFDNGLFSEPPVRKWLPCAAGIGSVSGRSLPDHVRGRCVNLSDAIDTDFFAPEKAPPARFAALPKILLPALIKPGKGQQDLLRAARILAAKHVDFEICFAGAVESDSLRQDLRKYAAAAGLEDRVLFLGELPQEEIRNYYALSSVVVLPTYTEGLPRVLLEAQAMQKPVVAYDSSGGVGETFLPNETGFLVKTGDVETLADRIGFLLANEAERLRMGEHGRQLVVRQFSVSALIQRHEAFYLRALSGGPIPASSKTLAAGRADA
jgi:glycosyltransferase involved in cell wall biosynthesis